MAWFEYGVPTKRHLRRGVCLRVKHLSVELKQLAALGKREDEEVVLVEITKILKDSKVVVRFWCRKPGDRFDRYTVFSDVVNEDPNWVCESDVGRGYKE